MNRQIFLFIVLVALFQNATAQQPGYQWAKPLGIKPPNGYSSGADIIADPLGNVYTVGTFTGTMDFDPGVATATRSANGGTDIFLAKLDSLGNFIWVVAFGATGYDRASSVALDQNNNVYVTGSYSLTADFDPGPGTFTMSSQGGFDGFVCKFDANGNFQWANSITGSLNEHIQKIAIDAAGNIGLAGNFDGTLDADPGTAVASHTTLGSTDAFVVKWTSAGSLLWSHTYGAYTTSYGSEKANDVIFDNAGNVYLAGDFQYAVDFDAGAGNAPLFANCSMLGFLLKLDPAGNYLWVRSFGHTCGSTAHAIDLNNAGEVILTGYMGFDTPTGDFDPGPGTISLTSSGGQDIYLVKLDGSGNVIWANSFGGKGTDWPRDVAFDRNGNIFTIGEFWYTADFDPSTGTAHLTSFTSADIFISLLSGSGSYIWAGRINGGMEQGTAVFTGTDGATYATGVAMGGTDFDPGPGTGTVTPFNVAAFALKFRETCLQPNAPLPHPANKKVFCLKSPATVTVTATDPIYWYSTLTSTNPVGSGGNFTIATTGAGTHTFYAATKTCTSSSRSAVSVTISACVDLPESTGDSYLVYPNPTSDAIKFSGPEGGDPFELAIYNVSGQLVYQHHHLQRGEAVHLRGFGTGVYFFRVNSEGHSYTGKVIVSE